MLIWLAIICGIGFILSIAFYFYFYLRFKSLEKNKLEEPLQLSNELSIDLENFQSEVKKLNDVIKLLEEFKGDYFFTLLQSGYNDLFEIIEALTSICKACEELIEQNKFDEAQEIIDFILNKDGFGNPPASVIEHFSSSSKKLISWSSQIQSHIDLIDQNLSQSSAEFQKIGRIRTTKRNPTSTILEEVRKVVVQTNDKKKNN